MNLAKRILFGVGLPRLSAPATETGPVQVLQMAHRTGETQDGVPSVQLFGFASSPVIGCDHVVIYAEGDRTKGVAVGSNDQRYRPKGMAPGESKQYDNAGQFIYLTTGQKIVVSAAAEIDFSIGGNVVAKLTAGGLSVTGTITSTGDMVANGISVDNHDHTYLPGGGSPTNTSAPVPGS